MRSARPLLCLVFTIFAALLLAPAAAHAASDLALTAAGPTQAQPGATIEITVTMRNAGPDAVAPTAMLFLGHPAGDPSRPYVELLSAPGCTTPSANHAQCTFGTIAATASADVAITVRLTSHAPAGTLTTVMTGVAVQPGTNPGEFVPGDGDTTDDEFNRALYVEAGDVTLQARPGSPDNDATPTFSFTAPGSAGLECRVDGAAFSTCTSPVTVGPLAEGVHSFAVRTAGRTDLGTVHEWTIDLTGPTVSSLHVEGSADGWVTDAHPDVRFEASEPGSRFECNLDQRADTCNPSASQLTLRDQGPHTLYVRAIDRAGNAGPWRSLDFRLDSVPPQLEMPRHPSQLTSDAFVRFVVRASELARFECNIGNGWKRCGTGRTATPGFGGLSMGTHAFRVRATDRAGNSSSVTTWTWQRVASPTLGSFSGPTGTVRSGDARFEFAANERGVRTFCSVDGAVLRECSSPFAATDLGDGSHTLALLLIDTSGDVRMYRRSWRVETPAPPRMTWSRGPAGVRYTTSSRFEWDLDKAGVRSLCSLDGGAFVYCDRSRDGRRVSTVVGGLAYGEHVMRVKLVDGVSRSTTWTWRWRVVRRPELASSSGPGGIVHDRAVAFSFRANKGDTWFTCQRDGGTEHRCASTYTWADLRAGDHSFRVTVHDTLGNSRRYAWHFTYQPAQPKLYLSGTSGVTSSRDAEFRFSSDRPGLRWQCRVDDVTYACSSPLRLSQLPDGFHRFIVVGTDADGNQTRIVQRTWEVVPFGARPTGATTPRFPFNPSTNGAGIIATGGLNIIATGGLNIIATGGLNIIATGGLNIIAAGGGNIIATGGGNIIAAGGGNIIATGGGN